MISLRLDPLPKDFVLAKPLKQDDYDEKIIYELEKKGKLIITRKRDGWKLFLVKANNRWKIYTDGINEVTERLPRIVEEIATLTVPDNSLLVGEGIVDEEGKDQFLKVGGILRGSNPSLIKIMIFDAVYWGCVNLLARGLNVAYSSYRLPLIKRLFLMEKRPQHVMAVQVLDMPYDEAKKMAVKRGWEGLVLYDTAFKSSFRLDGKDPERPEGCYKWKPIYEDDFIVRSWIRDVSKHPSKVKKVLLSQIDPKTGKEFSCGELGSFSNQMRIHLITAKLPLVMQVKFEQRYPSGKLRNARFMRLRYDKKPSDCIAPKKLNPVN